MRQYAGKRTLCWLLAVMLLLSLLPANALAVEAGTFVLVAEANGELVIAPEYVLYTQDQTLRQALADSGHQFTGLDSGMISEIDGVVGNYTRSDENGGFNLDNAASQVRFFRFSEDASSQPSDGLQKLMTAMADYKQKSTDVQAAAQEAYQTAYSQFVGISSESAATLADALNTAIREYENAQAGTKYRVTFRNGDTVHSGVSITAENPYGKVWTDDGDGVLELPAGSYFFQVSQNGLHVEGNITVTGSTTVQAAFPRDLWLKLDAFRLSGSYGAETNEENRFSDDVFSVGTWNDRKVTVPVADTFTGTVYTYAEYDTTLLNELPTLTAIYTSAQSGELTQQEIPFQSLTSGATGVLKKGAAGNTVVYRVSKEGTDGYRYCQDYSVTFDRIPSLTGLKVKDQNGVDQAATDSFDSGITEYTYKVLDTVTAVTLQAEPLDSSYQITINGQDAGTGVTVPVTGAQTVIPVKVSANGYENTYTVTIQPGAGKALSFKTERADVTLEVVNSNGEVMPYEKFREGSSGNRYQYTLVPGETYRYVATANTYYHIADAFTLEEVADSTIQVDVPTEDWLTALAFGTNAGSKYKDTLPLDAAFSAADHSYRVCYVDTEHLAYVWIGAEAGVDATAIYHQEFASALYHEKEISLGLTSGATAGMQLKRFLMDENPVENTLTIRLSKDSNGITYYQDYEVAFTRTLTLKSLTAQCEGIAATLVRGDGSTGFASGVKEYSVTVSMAADALQLALSRYTEHTCYGETEVGYRVTVDGTEVPESGEMTVPLDGTIQTQTVTIRVENEKAPTGSTEYILHILKSPPVEASFAITPADALLAVYETMSGERLWQNENGNFQLCEGYAYRYALTAYGYVGKSGVLQVTRDAQNKLVVTDGTQTYSVTENGEGGALTITWNLQKTNENSNLSADMTAQWPNFRGDDTNNSVVSDAIPTAAEEGTLYWANQIGSGYDADAVGSPILVDNDLITYAGDKIYRVDTVSGEIKAVGTMDHKSSFSITPPTYAEGMVFVALSNGTVQAFNARTLESLWVYTDPLGGQPNCPLTVKDGYLYTGFWNSEVGDANFVSLSITDEDPSQDKEDKCASWYYTAKGGYYWAGAYAADGYLLVGTDDGTNTCTGQSSRLLLLDTKTGALLDSWENLNGDIRSTVVYDTQTGACYFTSKGGSFYSVKVSKTDNGWKLTDKWSVKLDNGTKEVPMSTSSPVVYNGRAYVGVSGSSQFGSYSGHNITVLDLNKKEIAYCVQTQGYPQTSGLLTTAYEEISGYVYVYFFDNMTPGKLRVLRDKAGQTQADYVTTEGKYTTAYALFTPTGDHAQYAICSPIVDAYGTVYYKNDSACLMAFGSAIERIEVTSNPQKMVYAEGESFDPQGMVVTATYANGTTRDVTKYVTVSADPITAENPVVTIAFPYVLYHNTEDGTQMQSGIQSTTPVTTLQVSVSGGEQLLGDVNADGQIDILDANLVISCYYETITLNAAQLTAGDVNGDGEVDTVDAGLIISFFYGDITTFETQ